eukprot:TRINITY_DN3436_c0_g2_i3.p1 TRINITY_DN3436_c0_g2~~TRINITY_DN3436_c0_g2_i3.p1  ORF type:complete len:409 (+),score=45.54 TRINITY_DN3436_c0_g2_i3:337-1563(+)
MKSPAHRQQQSSTFTSPNLKTATTSPLLSPWKQNLNQTFSSKKQEALILMMNSAGNIYPSSTMPSTPGALPHTANLQKLVEYQLISPYPNPSSKKSPQENVINTSLGNILSNSKTFECQSTYEKILSSEQTKSATFIEPRVKICRVDPIKDVSSAFERCIQRGRSIIQRNQELQMVSQISTKQNNHNTLNLPPSLKLNESKTAFTKTNIEKDLETLSKSLKGMDFSFEQLKGVVAKVLSDDSAHQEGNTINNLEVFSPDLPTNVKEEQIPKNFIDDPKPAEQQNEEECIISSQQASVIDELLTEKVRYEGEWEDNLYHGKGILYNENPDFVTAIDFNDLSKNGKAWVKFDGTFRQGKRTGPGILFFANGEKFIGLFRDNFANGRGTFFTKEGKVIGEWSENKLIVRKA